MRLTHGDGRAPPAPLAAKLSPRPLRRAGGGPPGPAGAVRFVSARRTERRDREWRNGRTEGGVVCHFKLYEGRRPRSVGITAWSTRMGRPGAMNTGETV